MISDNAKKGIITGALILIGICIFTIVIFYIWTHKNDQKKEGFTGLNDIVVLSDIHIDPLYDYTSNQKMYISVPLQIYLCFDL